MPDEKKKQNVPNLDVNEVQALYRPQDQTDPEIAKLDKQQKKAQVDIAQNKAEQERVKTAELKANSPYGAALANSVEQEELIKNAFGHYLMDRKMLAKNWQDIENQRYGAESSAYQALMSEKAKPEAGFFEGLLGGITGLATLGRVNTTDLFDVRDSAKVKDLYGELAFAREATTPLLRDRIGGDIKIDEQTRGQIYEMQEREREFQQGLMAQSIADLNLKERDRRQHEFKLEEIETEFKARSALGANIKVPQLKPEQAEQYRIGMAQALEAASNLDLSMGPQGPEVHQNFVKALAHLAEAKTNGVDPNPEEIAQTFETILATTENTDQARQLLQEMQSASLAAIQRQEASEAFGKKPDTFVLSGRTDAKGFINSLVRQFDSFLATREKNQIQTQEGTIQNTAEGRRTMLLSKLGVNLGSPDGSRNFDRAAYLNYYNMATTGKMADGSPATDQRFIEAVREYFGEWPVTPRQFDSKSIEHVVNVVNKSKAFVEDERFTTRGAQHLEMLAEKISKSPIQQLRVEYGILKRNYPLQLAIKASRNAANPEELNELRKYYYLHNAATRPDVLMDHLKAGLFERDEINVWRRGQGVPEAMQYLRDVVGIKSYEDLKKKLK